MPDAAKGKSDGERLRFMLEDLGALWIKLGQLLSLQDDFFTREEIDSLKHLQDQVTPFANEVAREILKQHLGALEDSFLVDLQPQTLASGSIAQVYLAKVDLSKLTSYSQNLQKSQQVKVNSLEDFSYAE